jgi:hypothetical protein
MQVSVRSGNVTYCLELSGNLIYKSEDRMRVIVIKKWCCITLKEGNAELRVSAYMI